MRVGKSRYPRSKYTVCMEESHMKLKPMADNVLLKQHEAAETTVSQYRA